MESLSRRVFGWSFIALLAVKDRRCSTGKCRRVIGGGVPRGGRLILSDGPRIQREMAPSGAAGSPQIEQHAIFDTKSRQTISSTPIARLVVCL